MVKTILLILVGVIFGFLGRGWYDDMEVFDPYDMAVIKKPNAEYAFQERILWPLPMSSYVTTIWYRNPQTKSNWITVASVTTGDPYPISEFKILDQAKGVNIEMPEGVNVTTEDFVAWTVKR